jgi:hypothetical protein
MTVEWSSTPLDARSYSDGVATYRAQWFTGDEPGTKRVYNPGDYITQIQSLTVDDEVLYVLTLGTFHAGYDGVTLIVPTDRRQRGLRPGLSIRDCIRLEQFDTRLDTDQTEIALTENQFCADLGPVLYPLPGFESFVLATFTRFRNGPSYEGATHTTLQISDALCRTWHSRTRWDYGTERTIPCWGWIHHNNKLRAPFYWRDTGETRYSVGFFETSDGLSWSLVGTIARDDSPSGAEYSETHVIRLRDGRLLAAIRDDETGEAPTFTGNYHVWLSYSSDHGETWTEPVAGPLGNAFPYLCQLTDGRLLLLGRGPQPTQLGPGYGGPTIYVSHDAGETWSESPVELSTSSEHGWFMGGVLEEYAPNRVRVVYAQDLEVLAGSQNGDNSGGFYAELRDEVLS